MNNLAEFQEKLTTLRKSYRKRLEGDLGKIDQYYKTLRYDRPTANLMQEIRLLANSFAGSGASFGFPHVSEAGSALERTLLKNSKALDVSLLNTERSNDVLSLLESLKSACLTATREVADAPLPLPVLHNPRLARELIIAGGKSEMAAEMRQYLSSFDFNASFKPRFDALNYDLVDRPPAALIAITDFSREDVEGLGQFLARMDEHNLSIPIIFISPNEDFPSRLSAVRLGGAGYLNLPLDFSQLVEQLEQICRKDEQTPYSILVIENDEILGAHYTLLLEQAGMNVTCIRDPRQSIEHLKRTSFDLVLTDFHLPYCNGLELASIVRQDPAHISLPIIFISTENELERLLTGVQLGVDDFLTKPILPSMLVTKVQNRAARARALRSVMIRDSFTGLLNHTRLKEELHLEYERAKRRGGNFAYALLDIDNFKAVNDTHGHSTGDRVLKSLARLLQQKLRRTDHIGRYGGDEIGVILFDVDGSTAIATMEALRRKFQEITHPAIKGDFYCTFSCGIASFTSDTTPEHMSEAADKALYQAKEMGRNRVVLAP